MHGHVFVTFNLKNFFFTKMTKTQEREGEFSHSIRIQTHSLSVLSALLTQEITVVVPVNCLTIFRSYSSVVVSTVKLAACFIFPIPVLLY